MFSTKESLGTLLLNLILKNSKQNDPLEEISKEQTKVIDEILEFNINFRIQFNKIKERIIIMKA